MNEMPTMSSMAYSSASYKPDQFANMLLVGKQPLVQQFAQNNQFAVPTVTGIKEAIMPNANCRIVQVFIADPNENIPLENRLLYRGDQKLTDLTDQELFFEVDIKTLLAAHNEMRTKIIDKSVKERTEYLEAARIRDLKMTVVNVAQF